MGKRSCRPRSGEYEPGWGHERLARKVGPDRRRCIPAHTLPAVSLISVEYNVQVPCAQPDDGGQGFRGTARGLSARTPGDAAAARATAGAIWQGGQMNAGDPAGAATDRRP